MAIRLDNALKPGTVVNSRKNAYTIRRVLGAGGFGITYLAKTLNGNIPISIAVKEHFMAALCERDGNETTVRYSAPVREQVQTAMKDFISEAERLNRQKLRHPNIIAIDEVFEANNTAYYVMEYIEGLSIGETVRVSRKGKPFDEATALQIITPVLDAMDFLHAAKITHLDIKPDNILLDFDEIEDTYRPVIIDFGLSKHYDERGNPTSTVNFAACSEGYAPIEQYAGLTSFTPQADVYALAATLFFLLTGHSPGKSTDLNLLDVEKKLAYCCSVGVRQAIVRALNGDKNRRTQSVSEFAQALGLNIGSHEKANIKRELIFRSFGLGKGKRDMQPTRPVAEGNTAEADSCVTVAPDFGKRSDNPKRHLPWKTIGIAAAAVAVIGILIAVFSGRGAQEEQAAEPTADSIVAQQDTAATVIEELPSVAADEAPAAENTQKPADEVKPQEKKAADNKKPADEKKPTAEEKKPAADKNDNSFDALKRRADAGDKAAAAQVARHYMNLGGGKKSNLEQAAKYSKKAGGVPDVESNLRAIGYYD